MLATYSGTADCDNYRVYYKIDGGLSYGLMSPHGVPFDYRSYLKFGLDSVPDTCAIMSAHVSYYQYANNGLPSVNLKLIQDPAPLGAEELFFEIVGARVISPTIQSQDGWVECSIDSSALTLIDSCRATGWVSMAIDHVGQGTNAFAFGYTDSLAPFIHVEYSSSAIQENQRAPTEQARFSLAPNPTRSAFVTADHNTAASARLTLRDVVGRTVNSFHLGPSGRTRLDLRGLPPGVYLATLEAGTQSLTRKLVITNR